MAFAACDPLERAGKGWQGGYVPIVGCPRAEPGETRVLGKASAKALRRDASKPKVKHVISPLLRPGYSKMSILVPPAPGKWGGVSL